MWTRAVGLLLTWPAPLRCAVSTHLVMKLLTELKPISGTTMINNQQSNHMCNICMLLRPTLSFCLDFSPSDEVAVIDEIQMIKDPSRGWAWTRALLGLYFLKTSVKNQAVQKQKSIHFSSLIFDFVLCISRSLCRGDPRVWRTCSCKLCQRTHVHHRRGSGGEDWTDGLPGIKKKTTLLHPLIFSPQVHTYERLTPFSVLDRPLESLDNLRPGDCIVCFSKNDIYSISRQIEAQGRECAVIYGSLPPGT